jgi:hypothetical protein
MKAIQTAGCGKQGQLSNLPLPEFRKNTKLGEKVYSSVKYFII